MSWQTYNVQLNIVPNIKVIKKSIVIDLLRILLKNSISMKNLPYSFYNAKFEKSTGCKYYKFLEKILEPHSVC